LYEALDGQLTTIHADQIIQSSEWAKQLLSLERDVLFIGNDLPLHKETLQSILGERAFFADVAQLNPRPSELALLGRDMENEDVHAFVPNYVRLAEAEANWIEQQKNNKH